MRVRYHKYHATVSSVSGVVDEAHIISYCSAFGGSVVYMYIVLLDCTMHLHTCIHTCTSSGIKMRSLEILAYHFMNRQDHLNAKVHVLPIYHFIQAERQGMYYLYIILYRVILYLTCTMYMYMYMCVYAQ